MNPTVGNGYTDNTFHIPIQNGDGDSSVVTETVYSANNNIETNVEAQPTANSSATSQEASHNTSVNYANNPPLEISTSGDRPATSLAQAETTQVFGLNSARTSTHALAEELTDALAILDGNILNQRYNEQNIYTECANVILETRTSILTLRRQYSADGSANISVEV
jgi:hypothetical protein